MSACTHGLRPCASCGQPTCTSCECYLTGCGCMVCLRCRTEAKACNGCGALFSAGPCANRKLIDCECGDRLCPSCYSRPPHHEHAQRPVL